MLIWVTYHNKLTLVDLIKNHVAVYVSEDEDEQEELNQCLNCGKWCGQDDEYYGAGYCTECAVMCEECQVYYNHSNMYQVGESNVCSVCVAKKYPNCEKWHRAIGNFFDVEAVVGDVRVTFEYIGEGECGDYTGEEDDVPLLRFYTFQKNERADEYDIDLTEHHEHPDWDWDGVEDASYCTRLPVDTDPVALEKMAKIIAEKMKEAINDNPEDGLFQYSIRKVGEKCSWIDETWIPVE